MCVCVCVYIYINVCVCVYIYIYIMCFLQLIPGAGFHQKHVGFEWGPGDLLVYETNYKLQGIQIRSGQTVLMCERGMMKWILLSVWCFCSGPSSAGSPLVHIVRKDEDICSPILRKLFNESHLIFVGLQKIKEDVPSKNKKSQWVPDSVAVHRADTLLLRWPDVLLSPAGLWASVRTTGLWSERVWRSCSRAQVNITSR